MSAFSISSIVTATNASKQKAKTDYTPVSDRLETQNVRAAYAFDGEQEITDGKLMVSAASSTITSAGQSFSLIFSTGGQGYWDTSETYLLAPDDEEFAEYYKEFSELTVEEREAITQEYEEGLYEPRHFNSYVFQIYGTVETHDIVIPRSLTRNHIFNLDVVKMGTDVVRDWTNISSITIPKEVTELYSDTFQNVPTSMVFNVEAESKPEGWADGWNDGATVNYGYAYPEAKAEPLSKAGAKQYGDEKQNFIIGWYPEQGEKKPLILEYKLKKTDGSYSEVKYFEFSGSSIYDCVGYQIKDFSTSLFCDIEFNEEGEIDLSTAVLHNIYRAKTNASGASIPEPDFDDAYCIKPKQAFNKAYTLDNFIDYRFTGLSTFSGYTAIDLNIDISSFNVYESLKANYYRQHAAEIEKGSLKIRYRITSLTLGSFRVVYEKNGQDVTKNIDIVTPIPQYKIQNTKNNRVSFLLKNTQFDNGKIKAVTFVGFYITVDLMGERAPVARSSVITRFGYVPFMLYNENASVFDINLLVILMLVGYIALYCASATGLYFYLKNKYKNDEFRRMKTKKYVIKSLLGLLGSTIVLFAIVFIVLRSTAMNNAIVVFNPVDAYIIILSVISVVIIGYFIKYLVGVIKVEKERRRVLKLKLNEDVEDDGTN